MPWVEDTPQAAPGGGQWVEDTPAAASEQPGALDWLYQHSALPSYANMAQNLSAGFQHRLGSINRAGQRAMEHPIESLAALSPPVAMARGALDALGLRTPAGPAELAAAQAQHQQDAADRAAGLNQGVLGSVAYGVGESPETLVIPELRAFKGAGLLPGLGNAALTGAAMGGYSAQANDRNVGQGLAAGAAAGVAGKGIGAALGKVFNAVRGQWADQALQQADRNAAASGVNLRVGDLAPDSAMRKFEDIAKFVPGSGVAATTRRQAEALGRQVSTIQDDLAAPIAQRLAQNETPESIAAASAREALAQHEATVRALAAKVPKDVTIQPTNFMPALRKLATEYPDLLARADAPRSIQQKVAAMLDPRAALSAQDQQAVAAVMQTGLSAAAKQQALEQLSPGVLGRMQNGTALSAEEAHWLQSELGVVERALEASKNTAGRSGSGAKFVGEARRALLDDMDATAGVSAPFKAMRDYFRTNVLPYREDPVLRKLVDGQSDGLFEKLGSGQVARTRTLMDALTPEGQAAVRYGMFSRAATPAVSDNLVSGVSAAKIARGFDIGNRIGQHRQLAEIFTPDQQAAIAGVRDVAKYARRSADWAANPHTGAQNLPLNLMKLGGQALGGSALGVSAPISVLGPTVAARATTALSSNPAFKNLYFAAGGGTPVDSILQALAASGAASRADAPDLLDYLGQPQP